jgi:SAM-dependent methyltransferase
MSQEDKQKWDKKYTSQPKLLDKREPSPKLVKFAQKPDSQDKKALDFACGNGRNSIYLAKLGFVVDSLDISDIPLKNLDKLGINNINTKQIDLDNFSTEKKYDLIVKCNYLDKKAIRNLPRCLNKNGIMIVETYMKHSSNNKPNSNPDFLLNEGELRTFFDNSVEILEYDEFDNEPHELYRMRKQSIVVKKL